MKIRKERAHLCGATNLDFRSVESLPSLIKSKTPKLLHLDLLSAPKIFFDQILKSKYLKTLKLQENLFTKTYSFYKEKGKPTHEFIKISNSRESQLEKTGKIPFTGESTTLYDERIYSNYHYNSIFLEEIFKRFLINGMKNVKGLFLCIISSI